jgi:uncharacterized membrane protein
MEIFMSLAAPSPEQLKNSSRIFLIVYILYLLVIPFPFLTLVGLIFTYVFRSNAQGYLESHGVYLVRSFWIGLLYFVISGVLCVVLIGYVLIFVVEIWWLIRMAIGLKALLEEKPIANVNTWWF